MTIIRLFTCASVLAALLPGAAFAQDNYFQAVSGNWDVTGNWSLGSVPIAGQWVVVGDDAFNNTATISLADAFSGRSDIGSGALNSGAVVVEGGQTWSTGILYVGIAQGSGSLLIQGGATVNTSGDGRIGVNSGSVGEVTVTGLGSSWETTGQMRVGSTGSGTLIVTDGATVAAPNFVVGSQSTSAGEVIVGGGADPSSITVAGGIAVGVSGVGTLELAGNGLVVANSISGGTTAGSEIIFSGGELRIAGGIGGSAGNALVFNAAGGTIDVVNSSATVTLNGDGSGAGGFTKLGGGTLVMNGDSTHGGPTLLNQGKLMVHGSLSNTSVTAAGGTVLGGTGFIGGDVFVQSGATRAPGLSPGTMSGVNEFWAGGGIYDWEINDALGTQGGDPGWDLISLSGQLDIQATAANPFFIDMITLDLFNSPGLMANFFPVLDTQWTILSTNGGILNFDPDKFTLLTGNFANPFGLDSFSIGLTNNGNDLTIFYAGIPEPSRAMLISLALVGLMFRRRR